MIFQIKLKGLLVRNYRSTLRFIFRLIHIYVYIRVIPGQIDRAVTLTVLDFFPRNTFKGVPKKYRTRSFRFFEKKFRVNITQNKFKKLKMTMLDAIDLDKI